ncbi:MAG: uroporphyrinogen decarboxylase family protein [Thermincola sp.]|jgi:uroporphyrinogen decarboxylase|nr:uroporphyrinogen decarboxylase family protein [Thermincola sp.]MDT3703024.1 uroporphyrinogen decarboxylase family protein [Thermincola sp.]
MNSDKLSSAERMRALALRQGLDRVPVNPFALGWVAPVYGMTCKEYFLEPEKAFEAQLWAMETYQYDATPIFNNPNWAGWDFGGVLQFPESMPNTFPTIKKAVLKADDLEKLTLPDLDTAPGISRMLQFARLCRAKGYPASITSGSVFGIAATVMDNDMVFRWLHKDPELAHRIFRLAADYILKIADRYIEEFGAENCTSFATYPLENLLSNKFFEKYSLPYIQEIYSYLVDRGVKKLFIHLCGDHTKKLSFWQDVKLAPRTIFTIGDDMDIEATAKAIGEDHIIAGNLSTQLLFSGRPDQVFKESCDIITKMKDNPGGFILMPACAMPIETPPVNVYAMLKAARTVGQY